MFDYFIINCMEKPVSEKKSFSIKIWLPILIGIFCIAASVLTFVGIYFVCCVKKSATSLQVTEVICLA